MIRIPSQQQWKQDNTSDLFGDLSATRGISLDEKGYLKLSPRTFSIASEDLDSDFDLPLAIGRTDMGTFVVVTEDSPFDVDLSETAASVIEDTDSGGAINAPQLAQTSWGKFWQSRWYVTRDALLVYKTISNGNWTSALVALTAGVIHVLEVFANRKTMCITNGNTVVQIDTTHSVGTLAQLVLPTDYEAVGMAYSGGKMGIITRLAATVEGQGQEAYFFTWDGITAGANTGVPVGSDACVGVAAYKGTFVVILRTGQWKIWNGGALVDFADGEVAFPFYYKRQIWGDFLNRQGKGVNMWVEGDLIFANVKFEMSRFGRRQEEYLPYCPSGVWCYDPRAGLSHRYAPSASTMRMATVTSAHVDIATNVLTTGDPIPATGGIARYTNPSSDLIGGLTRNADYYVIKVSATTFKLALTRDLALAGTAIDLTSVGASLHSFLMFDILDYGASIANDAGAIALTGAKSLTYDQMLFGSQIMDHDSSSDLNHLQVTVPEIEARGYAVTSRVFAGGTEDWFQKAAVKFRPLKDHDAIVVKAKTKQLAGLPVSTSQNNASTTWNGERDFQTTADLSDVKTAFDAGEAIECEVLSGAGAGVLVKVTGLSYAAGVYAVILEEAVIGASSGRYLEAQFDNFTTIKKLLPTSTENKVGVAEILLGTPTKSVLWKLELRGVGTTIENLDLSGAPHTK